jgi:V/A-type H+-transporting ATPase subunit K
MTITTILLSFSALAVFSLGLYLLLSSGSAGRPGSRWMKGGLMLNMLLFAAGMASFVIGGIGDAMAAGETAAGGGDISLGLGLALIGVGLPTGIATIGAGIAVSSVGSASLAVITEKPEMFGRTLIYLGLAEGIAIYGLVVSILLLGRI